VPAYAVEVVDTTGCGDAFSAGFIRGLSLGRDLRGAAELGCAAAAQVAQGLGTDHGSYTLESVDGFARSTPARCGVVGDTRCTGYPPTLGAVECPRS